MVRAFVLLGALLEGECDAEHPPRNEKLIQSLERPSVGMWGLMSSADSQIDRQCQRLAPSGPPVDDAT